MQSQREYPSDVNCCTTAEHKNYYNSIIKEFTCKDTSDIITDFIVWSKIKPQDLVEVKDFNGCWFTAIVLKTNKVLVFVHYIGYYIKYREWISINSDRLQPHKTYINGKIRFHSRLTTQLTKNLRIGNWISEDFVSIAWRRIQSAIRSGAHNNKYVGDIVQGHVVDISNDNVTIKHDRILTILPKNKIWRVINQCLYEICPICKEQWRTRYYCNMCGYTHSI